VDVSAVVSEGTLQIGVCDRGPGVPAEALPRLFDRFYKADPSRQGGSGLGLAIARQHAVRMGGDLTAAPRDGGGLCFSLLVPVTVSLHDGDGAENPVTDDEGDTRRQT
jgi:signal transduction histidine kinase